MLTALQVFALALLLGTLPLRGHDDAELTFAKLQELQVTLSKSPERQKVHVISDSTNPNLFCDDHLKPFRTNLNGDYAKFVDNLPILATGMRLRQGSFGNHIGNYFELISCAKLAGVHYIGFPDGETKAEPFFDSVPTAILHPSPVANYTEAVASVQKHCWPSHSFPWQNSLSDWMHNLDAVGKIMENVIQSYVMHTYTLEAQRHVISLDSFDLFDSKTAPRAKANVTTPLVPDAAILFRCNDILDHAQWMSPYGILNFNTYPMVIPTTARTIYIVGEPKGYGKNSAMCNEILVALVDYLEGIYPSALIGVRRGHAFDSMAMLRGAAVTVCPPSTFCLWPAIAAAKDEYTKTFKYVYSSWLFANTRPVWIADNFHWLNFPRYHQFGDDFKKEELEGAACCSVQSYVKGCCDDSTGALAKKLVADLKTIRPPGPRTEATSTSTNSSSTSTSRSSSSSSSSPSSMPAPAPAPAAPPVALVAAAPPTAATSERQSSHSVTVGAGCSPGDKYALVNGVCPFSTLGLEYEAHKVGFNTSVNSAGQRYGPLYCDILTPLRSSTRKLRVLEIGFGCGRYNNGVGARVIKGFFKGDGGPDVLLWDIDYLEPGISEEGIRKCLAKFHTDFPGVVEDVYFGNQANTTFLAEVVHATGGQYDVLIDDGGHELHLIMPSFEYLWKHVAPGGWYIIEDLQPGLHHVVRLIAGWTEELACGGKGGACNRNINSLESRVDKYVALKRPDMREVRCTAEICAFRKAFLEPNATTAASHARRLRQRRDRRH